MKPIASIFGHEIRFTPEKTAFAIWSEDERMNDYGRPRPQDRFVLS